MESYNVVSKQAKIPLSGLKSFCITYGYVALPDGNNICLACYGTGWFHEENGEHRNTHFTMVKGKFYHEYLNCYVCKERVFSIVPREVCIICNRV